MGSSAQHDLRALGWDAARDAQFAEFVRTCAVSVVPARIARRGTDAYLALTEAGPWLARVSGRYRREAGEKPGAYPVVGDWVAVRPAEGKGAIEGLLPRRTAFVRKAPAPHARSSRLDEQVLVANVDVAFLVSSLNEEFNPRRIERYLVMTWESGAEPVLVLNKADLCGDPGGYLARLGPTAAGVPVVLTSAVTGAGMDELAARMAPGRTVAFLGSSGVGKSSLVNGLIGRRVMATGAIRDDGRGRHTTTRSDLLVLPSGAILIDTPGLRELAPWAAEAALDQTFADVAELAEGCRFRDCRHDGEPGCAVQSALEGGRLSPERLASYRKLQREQAFLRAQVDIRERLARRRSAKQLAKAIRHMEHP